MQAQGAALAPHRRSYPADRIFGYGVWERDYIQPRVSHHLVSHAAPVAEGASRLDGTDFGNLRRENVSYCSLKRYLFESSMFQPGTYVFVFHFVGHSLATRE